MMTNKFDSEPRLILAHKCNIDVNINMLASQLVEQLQKLIDEHGDGKVDCDRKDMERERETYERLKEKYG